MKKLIGLAIGVGVIGMGYVVMDSIMASKRCDKIFEEFEETNKKFEEMYGTKGDVTENIEDMNEIKQRHDK